MAASKSRRTIWGAVTRTATRLCASVTCAVHTGDLVVWGKRTDGSVLTPFMDYGNGGSLTEWIGTLDKVLQLDFDSAIPGHGPVLSKDDIRTFRRKLVTLRQRAEELVKSGVRRTEFMPKLKTDDLNWPFAKERIDPLYDELAATGK